MCIPSSPGVCFAHLVPVPPTSMRGCKQDGNVVPVQEATVSRQHRLGKHCSAGPRSPRCPPLPISQSLCPLVPPGPLSPPVPRYLPAPFSGLYRSPGAPAPVPQSSQILRSPCSLSPIPLSPQGSWSTWYPIPYPQIFHPPSPCPPRFLVPPGLPIPCPWPPQSPVPCPWSAQSPIPWSPSPPVLGSPDTPSPCHPCGGVRWWPSLHSPGLLADTADPGLLTPLEGAAALADAEPAVPALALGVDQEGEGRAAAHAAAFHECPVPGQGAAPAMLLSQLPPYFTGQWVGERTGHQVGASPSAPTALPLQGIPRAPAGSNSSLFTFQTSEEVQITVKLSTFLKNKTLIYLTPF